MTNKELLENIIIDCEYLGKDKAFIDKETIESIKKDLERLEKQDKIFEVLLKNADYQYDECYGTRGNQLIMIGIDENDECFEEMREMVEKWLEDELK